MQRIEITHTTTYRYPKPVRLLEHKLLVRPREGHDIRIEASTLRITPDYSIDWHRDVHGNSVAIVNFSEESDFMEIVSTVLVEHYETTVSRLELAKSARSFPFEYDPMEQIDLVPYQTQIYPGDGTYIDKWLDEFYSAEASIDTLIFLNQLNEIIANSLRYQIRNEPGVQSPGKTLSEMAGSCRDLATLFVETCRRVGLASRFVSGYLVSSAAVEDVATTHAWAEVYLPGAGWRGFDSTSGRLVGGDHIAVAVHRHPEAVYPVSGSFVGPVEPTAIMEVHVQVEKLHDVTL